MTAGRVEAAIAGLTGAVAVAVLGYRFGSGAPAGPALGAALAVLLVAVPGALRLATGLPALVGAGRAAQLGVLPSGPDVPAAARRVDTVVLAGTGLLGAGRLELQDVYVADGVAPDDVLRLAAAVAQESDRPLDRAIAAATSDPPGVAEFDTVGDLGVRGIVAEVVAGAGGDRTVVAHAVLVGDVALLSAHDIALPAALASATAAAAAAGRVPVAVAWDGVARAVLALGRAVAPDRVAAVRLLRRSGLRPVLLTAEPAPAARATAVQAGLEPDAVLTRVAPDDEAALVHGLRAAGHRVAVVADGTHGGALAAADLAVHLAPAAPRDDGGPGLVLVSGDLAAAVEALRLTRRTAAVTRANLIWALGCVAAVLPAAATGLLGPLPAGAATAAGAAVVVANSLRLQR